MSPAPFVPAGGTTGLSSAAASVTISYTLPVTATTTAVTSSANPSTTGQPVTYTATVSPTDGGGTVAFDDGGSPITGCTAQVLNGSGQATCPATYTAAGSHTITAAYSGDGLRRLPLRGAHPDCHEGGPGQGRPEGRAERARAGG